MPLACVWHKEQFYMADPVLQNSVGGLADENPYVSIQLSQNGFTMPTCVTFLVFGLFTNVTLMLLTSWLLALYAQSMICITANNSTCVTSQHLSARLSWSTVYPF